MKETIEEVLGSSMCQFSVIENKLAILYRNQVKIYDAITKEQDKNKYSEEEVLDILYQWSMYKIDIELERLADELPNILPYNEWFEQFKKQEQ
jgi:hypothetical protein